MSGTNTSELLSKLTLTSRPEARALGSGLLRGADLTFQSDIPLRVVDTRSQDTMDPKSGLSTEHVNKCMLVLLLICLVAAGAILGAVAYLRSEQLSVAGNQSTVSLGIADQR